MFAQIKKQFWNLIEKTRKLNPMIISTLLFFVIIIHIILHIVISDRNTFYTIAAGAFLAFLWALVLHRITLYFENKSRDNINRENTRYIYHLYKMELEMNTSHIQHWIAKRWIPYYRLKTITRDKLWGELADYFKDLSLMQKLNTTYGEFELINNKINLLNDARMARKSSTDLKEQEELEKEIKEQLEGIIGLGESALKLINDCLVDINQKIEILDEKVKKNDTLDEKKRK